MSTLTSALAGLLDRGQRPPCGDGSGRWLSDLPTERAQAVELCAGCPLIGPCHDAAIEHDVCHGVWAGVDHTRSHTQTRPTRRKRKQA